MKLILAATYAQAKQYAKDNKLLPYEWAYPDHREKIMGLENPEVIELNGYERMDDIQNIMELIATRMRP